jgi:hypothetical protein
MFVSRKQKNPKVPHDATNDGKVLHRRRFLKYIELQSGSLQVPHFLRSKNLGSVIRRTIKWRQPKDNRWA